MEIKNEENIRRKQLEDDMKFQDNNSIKERIDRYLEIEYLRMVGGHYFAEVSTQCFNLYRDGYFIGAVMMSHAINEGIIKFVAERNKIDKIKHEELLKKFLENKIISKECKEASECIWKSYRNDIHHMNPKVGKINFLELALKNLKNLAVIEKEIFGFSHGNGGSIALNQPKYWDFNENGTVKAFLRFE